jgi:hypothetical protein
MPSLYPPEIQNAARDLDASGFVDGFGEPLVAVVRLPEEGGAEVLETLASTLRDLKTRSVRPIPAMDFNTQIVSPERLRDLAPPRVGRSGVLPRGSGPLAQADHYAVRLRKRSDVDAAFSQRVSVGRATNKDIVLRHKSISKFHAWFEIDENGEVYVADAGSKNGTKVNDTRLAVREPSVVTAGDIVTFGSVEVLMCTPEQLWRLSRGR